MTEWIVGGVLAVLALWVILMYNGLDGTLERVDWKRDPKCPTCGRRRK